MQILILHTRHVIKWILLSCKATYYFNSTCQDVYQMITPMIQHPTWVIQRWRKKNEGGVITLGSSSVNHLSALAFMLYLRVWHCTVGRIGPELAIFGKLYMKQENVRWWFWKNSKLATRFKENRTARSCHDQILTRMHLIKWIASGCCTSIYIYVLTTWRFHQAMINYSRPLRALQKNTRWISLTGALGD